jgi:low temperature requirement protein LtrA
MSPNREPVSHVTGSRQMRALRVITAVSLAAAAISLVLPTPYDEAPAITALLLVMATPVLRVGWLIFRWGQERDVRFVLVGSALLGVVALGAVVSALGLGR